MSEYLIVWPDEPTAEEYARGARLIPSLLDEGVRVWRVPAPKLRVTHDEAAAFQRDTGFTVPDVLVAKPDEGARE